MGAWGDGKIPESIPAPGTVGRAWRRALEAVYPRFGARVAAGLEQEADSIDVDEAAGLERIRAKIADTTECPLCEGTGRAALFIGSWTCRACDGAGRIPRRGPG